MKRSTMSFVCSISDRTILELGQAHEAEPELRRALSPIYRSLTHDDPFSSLAGIRPVYSPNATVGARFMRQALPQHRQLGYLSHASRARRRVVP